MAKYTSILHSMSRENTEPGNWVYFILIFMFVLLLKEGLKLTFQNYILQKDSTGEN